MKHHYQIRLLRSDGCGSYLYFEADRDNAPKIACEKANEHLSSPFHSNYKPVKTGRVVEYDNVKKDIVRGGQKFKITLSFFEIGFKDGSRQRDEWYEPVNNK